MNFRRLAYVAAGVDAVVSAVMGREPQISLGRRAHGRHKMFVDASKLCASLLHSRPDRRALGARFAGTKRTDMWQAGRQTVARAQRLRDSDLMNILSHSRSKLNLRRGAIAGIPAASGRWPRFEAKFGGASVRAVLTAWGAHAREAARRMLRTGRTFGSRLDWGSSGSGYRPGDIVAPRWSVKLANLWQSRAIRSCWHRGGLRCAASGAVRDFANAGAHADEKLVLEAGGSCRDGKHTILRKRRVWSPSVAVRSISDTVDFDLPYDFERARDAADKSHCQHPGRCCAIRPRTCAVCIGARWPHCRPALAVSGHLHRHSWRSIDSGRARTVAPQ